MGDEVGQVRPLRQMTGERSGSVEHDHHRAGRELFLDAGSHLADMRVGDGEDDDVGAVERLVGVTAEKPSPLFSRSRPASLTSTWRTS